MEFAVRFGWVFEIDCCDGSDEYSGIISCPDTCQEEHARWEYVVLSVSHLEWKITLVWKHSAKVPRYLRNGSKKVLKPPTF